MADAPIDPEKFEEQLKADMASAKAEYEAILATKNQADKEYWRGIKNAASEALKLPESYSSKIEKYKSDALFLNQMAGLAGEHNYQALAAAELFSLGYDIRNEGKEAQGKSVVDYPKDFDLAVENWLYEWTISNKQIELEKLLLGEKVSQPEPMSIGERNGKIFQNPDENWQNIQNILRGEARAREQIADSFQRVVLKMAGKTLVHHGPSETAVASRSSQLATAQKKLERYQEQYDRWLFRFKDQGQLDEEAQKNARKAAQEMIVAPEKKKEEIKKTTPVTQAKQPEKKEETLEKIPDRYQEQYDRWLFRFKDQGLTDEDAHAQARKVISEIAQKTEKVPSEELAKTAPVPQPAPVQASPTPKRAGASYRISGWKWGNPSPAKAAIITAEGEEIQRGWNALAVTRYPGDFVRYKATQAKNWVAGKLGKKAALTTEKALIKKGLKKGLGTVVKTTIKKATGWLATRLALLVAPTGVTQVAGLILLAKDVLIGGLKFVKSLIVNKTTRDYILGAGVTGMILLKMLFDVILASAWTGAFGALGFFIGGLPGAAIGAFVGYTVGPTLSSAVGSLLGGGTTAGATTATTATTVSGAGMAGGSATGGGLSVTPGLLSTGGAVVTSLGSVAGTIWSAISAAATSGSFVVVSSVIAVGAVQIINEMRINSIFAQQPPPPPENTATGKSFSIQKTVNPTFVPGGTTAQVIYTVTISANENISGITVVDKFTRENKTGSKILPALVPEKPWPTSMTKGETITINFKAYTVDKIADANSNLVNRITVSINTESLSAEATATVGNPDYTASRCQIAPAGNACSPNQTDMVKYFGGDPAIANNASRICYAESKGVIGNVATKAGINDSCDPKYHLSPDRQREYSVGLFQINLWAHSSLCLQVEGVYENPFKYPYKSGCVYPQCTPCLGRNQDLLNVCAEYWMRPENNIKYAWELSNHGTDWYPDWSTAGPTVCNIP